MKRVFNLCLLVCTLMSITCGHLFAEMKMGYVNFDAAFANEKEAQSYINELEGEEKRILEEEQKVRLEIETKVNGLSKLSAKARQEREKALGNEINALQQQFAQKRMELNQKRQNILADLESKNRLLLDSISKREGYSVVFNAAAMVFASDEIKKNDLTQKLVDAYNNAYKVAPAKKDVKTSSPPKPVQSQKK